MKEAILRKAFRHLSAAAKIIEYLGSKDEEFRAELVAHFLADEKILKGFTEHVNEQGTDEEKTFVMGINEIWNDTMGQK